MPTALLAPTANAVNSGDITVVSGTTQTVGLYTAVGGPIPAACEAPIRRKNPSGTYDDTGLMLSCAQPQCRLDSPGVYRVEKPVTSTAIGLNTD